MSDHEFKAVVRRERLLLDPAVRSHPDVVADFLHPDYVEFGTSGRVWSREAVTTAVAQDPAVDGDARDFSPVLLAPDVVLLTYRIDGDRASLRSSVWVRGVQGRWQLRFHQGTPASADAS